jgi:hypothetical protein
MKEQTAKDTSVEEIFDKDFNSTLKSEHNWELPESTNTHF